MYQQFEKLLNWQDRTLFKGELRQFSITPLKVAKVSDWNCFLKTADGEESEESLSIIYWEISSTTTEKTFSTQCRRFSNICSTVIHDSYIIYSVKVQILSYLTLVLIKVIHTLLEQLFVSIF